MQNKLACSDAALKLNTFSFTSKCSFSNYLRISIFSLSNAICKFAFVFLNCEITISAEHFTDFCNVLLFF